MIIATAVGEVIRIKRGSTASGNTYCFITLKGKGYLDASVFGAEAERFLGEISEGDTINATGELRNRPDERYQDKEGKHPWMPQLNIQWWKKAGVDADSQDDYEQSPF